MLSDLPSARATKKEEVGFESRHLTRYLLLAIPLLS